MKSNGSCKRTEQAPWKARYIVKCSGGVLVAGNIFGQKRLGEIVRAAREHSAFTVGWTPEKPYHQSSMAANVDGCFVHNQT